MSAIDWYLGPFQKFAKFEGRASRKEYWMFVVMNIPVAFLFGVLDALVGAGGVLGGVYNLILLVPSVSLMCRRLHDQNRSGWWQLLLFIPIVGFIVILVFMCLDGTAGDNRFGSDPKRRDAGESDAVGVQAS